ncbi:hypothetical protein AB0B28_15215 [Glycomyces sp. NPDC046736]|uniref:hypothetical protein n=1 Tax=Glycomyces sp. NPDC046736 TaxID=3155615 RepID=UPI0033E80215
MTQSDEKVRHQTPRRSLVVVYVSSFMAAAMLVSSLVWLNVAGPARADAATRLLSDPSPFEGEYYLQNLDALARLWFLYPGLTYLGLAAAFAALALAVRIGPRWSIIAAASLVALGLAHDLGLWMRRVLTDIADMPGHQLNGWLAEAAPSWFLTSQGLPTLATAAGLAFVALFLIVSHLRSSAYPREDD